MYHILILRHLQKHKIYAAVVFILLGVISYLAYQLVTKKDKIRDMGGELGKMGGMASAKEANYQSNKKTQRDEYESEIVKMKEKLKKQGEYAVNLRHLSSKITGMENGALHGSVFCNHLTVQDGWENSYQNPEMCVYCEEGYWLNDKDHTQAFDLGNVPCTPA